MTAPIQIEHLKWGKLVAGPDQHVPADQGYAVTRRSRGLPSSKLLLSSRTLLGAPLNPHRLCPEAARDGVFVLRRNPAAGASSGPGIVMMRARFLSEAGTKVHGRNFELTEFWNVERDDWLDSPGLILSHAFRHLRAVADPIEEPVARRLEDDPILLPRTSRRHPDDAFERFDRAAQGTVVVLHHLLQWAASASAPSAARRAEFGLECFPDEAAFFDALAEAVDILAGLGSDDGTPEEVAALLDGLAVVTGYASPTSDLGALCLTFRPILFKPPRVDRAATRQALVALSGLPERALRLGAAIVPSGPRGNRRANGRQVSLENFARSFEAVCRQPGHDTVQNLIEEASPLVLGESSFIESRNRRAINRLHQPAWRFLVGLAASSSPSREKPGASFLDLWTTLVILAQDSDETRSAAYLQEVLARLRDSIRSQAILIPEELALLEGRAQSELGQLDERAWRRVEVVRQCLLHRPDCPEEALDRGLIETSRSLAHWLSAVDTNGSGQIPDAATRDRIVRHLLVRFEQMNWPSLNRAGNAEFIKAFMPAVVASYLEPTLQNIGITHRSVEALELKGQSDSEAAIQLAELTRRMIAFVQPVLDPRPNLWSASELETVSER